MPVYGAKATTRAVARCRRQWPGRAHGPRVHTRHMIEENRATIHPTTDREQSRLYLRLVALLYWPWRSRFCYRPVLTPGRGWTPVAYEVLRLPEPATYVSTARAAPTTPVPNRQTHALETGRRLRPTADNPRAAGGHLVPAPHRQDSATSSPLSPARLRSETTPHRPLPLPARLGVPPDRSFLASQLLYARSPKRTERSTKEATACARIRSRMSRGACAAFGRLSSFASHQCASLAEHLSRSSRSRAVLGWVCVQTAESSRV